MHILVEYAGARSLIGVAFLECSGLKTSTSRFEIRISLLEFLDAVSEATFLQTVHHLPLSCKGYHSPFRKLTIDFSSSTTSLCY
jgi:hypothetical protein